MRGYREAISTIQEPTSSTIESAAWFNILLEKVWRVNFPKHADSEYICPCTKSERDCICNGESSYGGLEPLISSHLGEALINAMKNTPYMQPNDIAYISLDSITLGTLSPLIRSVVVQSVERDGLVVNLSMDVDAILEESDIILGKILNNPKASN